MNNDILKIFGNKHCQNKEELVEKLRDCVNTLQDLKKHDLFHSSCFYTKLESKLHDFIAHVEGLILPCGMEGLWGYEFRITYCAIDLLLCHYRTSEVDDSLSFEPDHVYTLLSHGFNMLTTYEYSEQRGIALGTVRQWIRRGKLRAVEKRGAEWYISELADVPVGRRTYEPVSYFWQEDALFSKDYAYMSNFNGVTIAKSPESLGTYVFLYKNINTGDCEKRICSKTEREKLETYLIANPFVKCRVFPLFDIGLMGVI